MILKDENAVECFLNQKSSSVQLLPSYLLSFARRTTPELASEKVFVVVSSLAALRHFQMLPFCKHVKGSQQGHFTWTMSRWFIPKQMNMWNTEERGPNLDTFGSAWQEKTTPVNAFVFATSLFLTLTSLDPPAESGQSVSIGHWPRAFSFVAKLNNPHFAVPNSFAFSGSHKVNSESRIYVHCGVLTFLSGLNSDHTRDNGLPYTSYTFENIHTETNLDLTALKFAGSVFFWRGRVRISKPILPDSGWFIHKSLLRRGW